MREIVTLQFGHFSNFIGTHYWNIQQTMLNEFQPLLNNPMVPNFRPEIESSVLYRESRGVGVSIHSENEPSTFYPRLLVFDLKGSRGSLRKQGYKEEPYRSITPEFVDHQKELTRWEKLEVLRTFENKRQTKFTKNVLAADEHTRELIVDNENEQMDENEYDHTPQQTSSHSAEKQIEPQAKKSKKEYSRLDIEQDLEESVALWSDFLQVDFHSKTICEPIQFQFAEDSYSALNVSNAMNPFAMDSPFDIYTTGKEVLHGEFSNDQYDDFTSQLLYFVEECDTLDGFQLFTDSFNAWGMTCSDFTQLIKDEIGSKVPLISYAASPYIPDFASDQDRMKFILNTCLTYADMYQNTNLFIPNSCQQLPDALMSEYLKHNFNPKKLYHSASILASAFDSVSLAYRLNGTANNKQTDLYSFIQEMSPLNALRVANINIAFPYRFKTGTSLFQHFRSARPIHQNEHFVPLLSQIATGFHACDPLAQSLLIRGLTPVNVPLYHQSDLQELNEIRMKRFGGEELEKHKHLIGCNSHFDMIDGYMNQTRCFSKHAFHVNQPFKLPFTFPQYLNNSVLTRDGLIRSHAPTEDIAERVETCPLGTHLSNSRNFSKHIHQLVKYFDTISGRSSSLSVGGSGLSASYHYNLSPDELKEYKEILGRMLDNYEDEEADEDFEDEVEGELEHEEED
ncbi:hypothetical protein C9374_009959 [Naegleria lovaniensis]|uniref:Uncharacterized protein n=1 Tax=Naegleria lovaniensis TaxID=51637 RepID=A0AA88KGY8_NAELO|nr:uncharacterized protein C9374_009959 [Naegleria lovaniensis]KAG2375336.1 hypothetical protein C9374_009959 [Naegleria lovaniensis]